MSLCCSTFQSGIWTRSCGKGGEMGRRGQNRACRRRGYRRWEEGCTCRGAICRVGRRVLVGIAEGGAHVFTVRCLVKTWSFAGLLSRPQLLAISQNEHNFIGSGLLSRCRGSGDTNRSRLNVSHCTSCRSDCLVPVVVPTTLVIQSSAQQSRD